MKTIFCDIDGTLIFHKSDIIENLKTTFILSNVLESIKQWNSLNYTIILTTGRKESTRTITETQLSEIGIIYDKLIMGLPNGERVIINDKKPNGINNTAFAINLCRNSGFDNINLNSQYITIPDKFIFNKITKPWGYEELIECNDKYVVKKLFMKKDHSCSIQYHEIKKETITVLSGKLLISIGLDLDNLVETIYTFGQTITINPYTIHSMKAIEDDCLYMETSTNELWDVVRLRDNYNRV